MIDEPESPKPEPATGDIKVGDISHSTGVAIGHGAQATVTQAGGPGADEVARAFAALLAQVQALPDGPAKDDAAEAVQKLEAEARRGDEADEGRVRRWLAFLAETAPDAWEVAVATFTNPIKGVATVFQKVAARARAEKGGAADEAQA